MIAKSMITMRRGIKLQALSFGLAGLALLHASPADAEGSAKVFIQQIKAGNREAVVYFDGMTNGMTWAVTFSNEPKVLCIPQKLALTHEQALDIVERYVAKYSVSADYPLGAVMMGAFRETFPCG